MKVDDFELGLLVTDGKNKGTICGCLEGDEVFCFRDKLTKEIYCALCEELTKLCEEVYNVCI